MSRWDKAIAELAWETIGKSLDDIKRELDHRLVPLLDECYYACQQCEHPALEKILEDSWLTK